MANLVRVGPPWTVRYCNHLKSRLFSINPADDRPFPPARTSITRQVAATGFGLAVAYWLAHSLVCAWAGNDADFFNTLFPADPGVLAARLCGLGLFLAFVICTLVIFKRREAAVAAAEQDRLKALADITHEIRSPLNAVIGMTELLQATELAVQRKEALQVLHAAAQALMTVVDDGLELARIEAGNASLKAAAFDVRALVGEAAGIAGPQARDKNLDLQWKVSPEIPAKLVGDPDRLRQVMLNLLTNAVKFTECGGIVLELGVRAETPEELEIHLSVTYTGSGIALEDKDRIFDAFYQGGSGAVRHHGGTGLGLNIAARLVDLMGGRIWVESRPGEGSTFHVTLRLGKVAASEMVAETVNDHEKIAGAAFAGPLRLLVVEDLPYNQKFMTRLLENWGHRADVAASGEQAVAAAGTTGYDLILMDVRMSGVDGLEAARRIRKEESSKGRPRTPIIAVTAGAAAGERQRCLAAGMDECIFKPVAAEKLARAIGKLTAGRKGAPIPPAAIRLRSDTGPPSGSRIDLEALRQTVGGDSGFARELVETFLEDAPKRVQAIREALNAGQTKELGRAAHDLKGMLRGFELESGAAVSERLEALAVRGPWDDSAAKELAATLAAQLAGIRETAQRDLKRWE